MKCLSNEDWKYHEDSEGVYIFGEKDELIAEHNYQSSGREVPIKKLKKRMLLASFAPAMTKCLKKLAVDHRLNLEERSKIQEILSKAGISPDW